MEEHLVSMGYEVLGSATSGEEAIDLARRLRPDIILMDIVMPGKLDGIDASERIKAELNIPVIFLTAYADDKFVNRAKNTEPFGYILKPFQEKEIKAAIEIAIYKKSIEQQLRESEEKYRSLVNTANDAIISVDSRGNIVFWNSAAEKFFGYPADETIGKPVTVIIPERFREVHQKEMMRVVSTEKSNIIGKTVEITGLRKDASEFPLEISFASWKTREGVFFTSIVRDITERKQAEEALKVSQESFHNIVEKNTAGIIVTDRKGIIRFVNPAVEDIFNRKSEELVGDLFGFTVIEGEVTNIDIIRKGNDMGIGEIRNTVTEWDGEFAYLIMINDITKRQQAEEALRQSKDYINNIISSMIESLIVTNRDGIIKKVNRATWELFGYEEKEFIGKPISMLFAAEEFKTLGIDEILKKGFIRNVERVYLSKDGRIIPILFSGSVMRDIDKNIQGIVCLAEDITERKKAEDELKKHMHELERFEHVTIGRELKMIELKNKIKELEEQRKMEKVNDET
ncbi:PAS domain S-box protein [bacterium]|nr:PAS domain S-box protein [bacterium]